ncbi:MAG: hypothetical protein ACI39R_03935 [Lachnospiraceae bacterium]
MAKCKCGKCGSRIMSNGCKNVREGCFDVCTTPICADPGILSVYAPIIYDEIGINLCTTFCIDIPAQCGCSDITSACAQLLDLDFCYGEEGVEITQISGRPNCYLVKLSNLTAKFAIKLFGENCRLVDTIFASTVYLPSCKEAETYDEDTNPSSVTLEIFAPYGVSYKNAPGCTKPHMALNFIGFKEENNFVRQGINVYAIPKVLNLDVDDETVTVGLTLVIQSAYFAGYKVESRGKIRTPKGSLIPEEESDCRRFVAGELLNLAIKPLDLGTPECEENLKEDCDEEHCCGCRCEEEHHKEDKCEEEHHCGCKCEEEEALT